MQATFLFLGTGGSIGVPVIGCQCDVCTSPSIFNKRMRPSGLIVIKQKQWIIDVGPDFRQQALHYGISHLDGVLLTHSHYDHIGGMDELRVFYFFKNKKMPIVASKETYEEIRHRFGYLFEARQLDKSVQSVLDFTLLKNDFGKTTFEGLPFEYVSYFQANMKVTGFKLGNFAYISDIRDYSPKVISSLKGVDILVLSATHYTPSDVHFSIDEAITFAEEVGAKKTFLNHISHRLEHDQTNQKLPEGISLAHDGLELEFTL